MGDRTFRPTPLADILTPRRPASRTPVPWRGRPGERKPLWAILGEEPPHEWRPPEAKDVQVMELAAEAEPAGEPAAPGPGPDSNGADRTGPGIYVTAHPTFGVGPLHTAIEYVPEKGDRQWISAGPSGGRLVSKVGMSDGSGNPTGDRTTDDPNKNITVGRLTPPEGMTDAEYWGVIKALDEAYRDGVDYDTFPEIQDSYNSNSYARGILDASGGTYTAPFDDYVGGRSPLPTRNFAPPHLRDTGYPDSLRPQPKPRLRRYPDGRGMTGGK